MYGGRTIPMALNTAVCFLVAGAGLVIKGSCKNADPAASLRGQTEDLAARVKFHNRTDTID